MDKPEIEKKIKEILEIVKLCPESLQEKCFEILFTHALSNKAGMGEGPTVPSDEHSDHASTGDGKLGKKQKVFLTQHKLSEEQVNQLMDFSDESNATIDVVDLKTKTDSKRQKRLALLVGLRHFINEEKFSVPVEELKQQCQTYGCFNKKNFSTYNKNMGVYEHPLKDEENILSSSGKKELADLIKELASTEES